MKLAITIHDHPWASMAVAFGIGAGLAGLAAVLIPFVPRGER